MGTRMAPSYANLFLAKFETNALSHASHQLHTWWSFIDDIFMSGPTQKMSFALLLLTLTIFTPLSNSLHPIQQHLLLFSTSRSHSTSLAKLRPISILNRLTNTSTLYNHRVTLYIRNEPFHSALLSDYDAYTPPTKASHYAPMNSSNTLTIVDTTSLFSKRKSNEFTQSHAMKHSNPVTLPQTNPVAFRLLSHTILLFASYQVSYKNILKSFGLPHDATTSFKRQLLLLFDEPRTLGTF